jgi:hypothetical protein
LEQNNDFKTNKEGGKMKKGITLKCYNPQGQVKIPASSGLSNKRVKSLAGKKIGIFWDGKMGGDNFCVALEELLKKEFPTTTTIRLVWGDVDAVEKAKQKIDAFIYAVGDSGMGGWIQCREVITLEKFGIPGVFVVAEIAAQTVKLSARDVGFPALRFVSIPSIDYFPNRLSVERLRPVAAASFNLIMDALTRPLTLDEKNPALKPQKEMPSVIEITSSDYDTALIEFNKYYLENHWGDGLPLIPPTPNAVKHMLTGTTRSPADVIGMVPFRNGIATVEKIAINSVMAGAKPEYLPVIIAAMEGLTDEKAFFSHMLSSEGSFTMMIMVSGPIGKEINMNSGVGLIGHGWQSNNTIGRAVRLNLINLGYLWPGEIDMALIGRPSSHTFYAFAENMEQSPWESFNEGLGYQPTDSCVTVSAVGGIGGMGSRIYGAGTVGFWDAENVLNEMVKEIAHDRNILADYKLGVANPAAHFKRHIFIIHPELAIILKQRGFNTKQKLQDYLLENTKIPYQELSPQEIQGIQERIDTKPGGVFYHADAIPENWLPVFKKALKPGGKVPILIPEDIHLVVAGSIPGYSISMSYLRIAHQTKLIKGAILTKSGR